MSGIAGAFFTDGRPVDPGLVEQMLASLAHRGPDGTAVWADGQIGLGHAMLRSTPESLHERLPFQDPDRSLAITADARIDNRAELIRTLDLPTAGDQALSDSRLILAAYARWGTACPDRLVGDFAFAIWDGDAHILFCARDHVGVRPFFYSHQPEPRCLFASEIKALLATSLVPRRLNETRVADYLLSMHLQPADTFFADIQRLPAGHCMTVSSDALRVWSYWSPDASSTLRLGSDAAYAEAFHDVFAEAVRCRLRSVEPIGAMLSGGLDSSAIVAEARRLLEGTGRTLWTFSTVFDEGNPCNESVHIRAVLDSGGFRPHLVPFDHTRHHPVGDLRNVLRHHDEPVFRPNASQSWQLHDAIRGSGCRVVLDGHGGDEVVSQGYGHLRQLALERRWWTLARELRWLSANGDDSHLHLLRRYIEFGMAPVIGASAPLRFSRRLWRAARRRLGGGRRSESPADLVQPSFAQRIDLANRQRAWRSRVTNAGTEREHHWNSLASPLQVAALEALNLTAGVFSTEVRFPFWDRRLVEFCLALPAEQKLSRGWGRLVMRRAMEGILPPSVQWRRDKTDFFPNVTAALTRNDRAELEKLDRRADRLHAFVNVVRIRAACERLLSSDPAIEDYYTVVRVASLYNWLDSGAGQSLSGQM